MNETTVEIFRSIIAMLTPELVVTLVVDNGDGTYTMTTKCTWWLSINHKLMFGGNKYVVTSFVFNDSITVKSEGTPVVPVPGSQILPAPMFIHGTLKMANNDVDAQPDRTILCPFVYLYEIIKDDKNTDEESMIDRTTDTRLFFLHSVNSASWTTDDHYTNFVKPMQQMVRLFVDIIKNSKLFTYNLDYSETALINVSEKGDQTKGIFDCNLSGIELRLFAEIRENLSCSNNPCC